MKKTARLIITVLLSVCVCAAVAVYGAAAPADDSALFTVTTAEGTVTEYFTVNDLATQLMEAPNNATITVCRDIDLKMSENTTMDVLSNGASRVLYLDLAGHGIYNKEKMNIFNVGEKMTLNVYSSAPGGFLYTIKGGTWGGCIFNISGTGATVNCGTMEINGVTYDGNNLSTFSSCFINLTGEGTVGFNGVGGNHFASAADWKGFICPRTGDGSIKFKDSNLIIIACTQFIHSESTTPTLSFENCVIVDAEGKSGKLLNGAEAQIYFKDCISTFSIITTTTAKPVINLEGENIFASELGFDTGLVKNAEGKVLAKINKDFTFVGGAEEVWAYDGFGGFDRYDIEIPKLKDACILCDPEDTAEYEFIYKGESVTEVWHKAVDPTPPFELSETGREGLYKPGWVRRVIDTDKYQLTGGLVADFDIKVAAEYDTYLRYYIFIPAFLVDEGYLDFTTLSVDGGVYDKSDWAETKVDGEDYYYATTPYLEETELNRGIEFYLPCEFSDKSGKPVSVNTVWTLTLEEYIDRVLADESKWTEDQIALVDEMVTALEVFKAENEPENDDALLPDDEYTDEEGGAEVE